MCANCAPNYYLRPNSQCQLCPSKSGRRKAQLEAAGAFLLVLLGLYVFTGFIVWMLEVQSGVDRKSALSLALGRSWQFCLWFVLCAQFMSSSVSSMSAGLPERLMYAFTLISFFSFDSDHVSFEGCDERTGYPFATQRGVLILGLVLVVLQISLTFIKRRVRLADLHRAMSRMIKTQIGEIVTKHAPDGVVSSDADSNAESDLSSIRRRSSYQRISAFQGTMFALLNALFTLMAKTCLRFVDCREGLTVLAHSSVR
jgi:hypothetical protein